MNPVRLLAGGALLALTAACGGGDEEETPDREVVACAEAQAEAYEQLMGEPMPQDEYDETLERCEDPDFRDKTFNP